MLPDYFRLFVALNLLGARIPTRDPSARAVPAGVLADIVEKRRFILVIEITVVAVSALFATLLSAGVVGPITLLIFVFLVGCAALEAPAWQSIVPQLVPHEDLPSAVAANSVRVNISRALGPRWREFSSRA